MADLTPIDPYGKVGTMKRVYLFPGQGAQYPGMGIDLYRQSWRVERAFPESIDHNPDGSIQDPIRGFGRR